MNKKGINIKKLKIIHFYDSWNINNDNNRQIVKQLFHLITN
jgi:hypothetical protein